MNETLNSWIYDYFKEHHGACKCNFQEQHQHNHKPHLHSALAKVRRKKNELKKKFCWASKDTMLSKSDLAVMGKAFHDIVKQHSRFRREVQKEMKWRQPSLPSNNVHVSFGKFSENLLSSDDCSNATKPSFGADIAFDFFRETYATASNEVLSQPSWMPYVPAPSAPFHHDPITLEDITQTLKKCRCGSSPNPLDGIPYTILKRCPSLHPAPLHLYNTCLMTSDTMWKKAVIRLIPKSSAQSCPSDPKNSHPIALTSCIGKVFTSIVKHRWDAHMTSNHYLDTNIQNAFRVT